MCIFQWLQSFLKQIDFVTTTLVLHISTKPFGTHSQCFNVDFVVFSWSHESGVSFGGIGGNGKYFDVIVWKSIVWFKNDPLKLVKEQSFRLWLRFIKVKKWVRCGVVRVQFSMGCLTLMTRYQFHTHPKSPIKMVCSCLMQSSLEYAKKINLFHESVILDWYSVLLKTLFRNSFYFKWLSLMLLELAWKAFKLRLRAGEHHNVLQKFDVTYRFINTPSGRSHTTSTLMHMALSVTSML